MEDLHTKARVAHWFEAGADYAEVPGTESSGALCLRRAHDSDLAPFQSDHGKLSPSSEVDPVAAAFESIFEMAQTIAARTGHIRHELIGFECRTGTPTMAEAIRVERSELLHRSMQQMLERWPLVCHLFQGWSLPESKILRYHQPRSEVIVIVLHTENSSHLATCKLHRRGDRPGAHGDVQDKAETRLEIGALRPISKVERDGC